MSETTRNGAAADYRFGRFIVSYRWLVLALAVIVSLAAAAGVQFLTNNPDNRVFFSKDNPHLLSLERLEKTYTRTDNIMFVLAPKDGDVFTRETLTAIWELTDKSWQMPYSSRVDSIANYQHTRADGDDLVVESLIVDPAALTDERIAWTRDVALSRPLLANRLVSDRGHVAAVNINIIKPDQEGSVVPEVAAFARALADDFRAQYPDIEIYMTGGVMFDVAFVEVPEMDARTLMPIMFGLIIVIMMVSLRSVAGTVLTLIVIIFSVAGALGLAGWAGVVLNAGTMSAPVIIMTLSIAHCVHILVSMRLEQRKGLAKHDAIVESLRINMAPVFVTSVTTAIGFLSMNFSDAPPFRLLGNIVATGVIVAFILSVTLVPAAMAILPGRVREGSTAGTRFMGWFGDFVVARRTALLVFTSLTILVISAGILRITLDDNFVEYFGDEFEIRSTSIFVEANLTGLNAIEYSIPSGEDGGINDPDYLSKLERFTTWYRAQDKVTHVYAVTDIVKQLNMNMHGDDPAYYAIPEERALAAQYMLVYEMSLPYGLDLNDQINVSKSATRMTVLVTDISSREMRVLDLRARQWLHDNAPELETPGTGLSMIFAHISDRNIRSMLFGSITALILISAILIFALQSFRIGLISLLPNLFPAALAFGLWGYLTGELGLAVAIVATMTLGIVVDDTVHFLSKYLRARRELGMESPEAVRYAFRTVGVALWITSVTLMCGFGVLAFSGFKVNADMGVLSALTIGLALFADFLFLPPLLMRLDARRS